MNSRAVEIVGAGPAGLSAALAARANGANVVVYEKRPDIGARFHGDFQGLENWTSQTDVLVELEHHGIKVGFDHLPVHEIVIFGPDESPFRVCASAPIFYLVRRGRDPGTLDQSLKAQALAAGITIRFGQRQRKMPTGGIVAEGPHRADVIASGYVFQTDMADGYYAALSDQLAPAGYSYLLVARGRGTIATCLFDDFHNERAHLEATVEFFRRQVGLRWQNAHRFGGSGNYQVVRNAAVGNRLYAGEAAGFQDALFGFGLRYALTSGHLAGRTIHTAGDYDKEWRKHLRRLNEASVFNRWLFRHLGDTGRKVVLAKSMAGRDPRRLLQRIYAPAWWKSALAKCVSGRAMRTTVPQRSDCDCTWCRCNRDSASFG